MHIEYILTPWKRLPESKFIGCYCIVKSDSVELFRVPGVMTFKDWRGPNALTTAKSITTNLLEIAKERVEARFGGPHNC